uniref:(northern house mosquito) hypothetical protein n=1 Tax=Culex pipiens TaxID=7175 RepID=A0A8D8J4M0_CULPI
MCQRVVRQIVPLTGDARRQRGQRREELSPRVGLALLRWLMNLCVSALDLYAHANVRTSRTTAVPTHLRNDHDRILVRLRDLLLPPVPVEQVGDLLVRRAVRPARRARRRRTRREALVRDVLGLLGVLLAGRAVPPFQLAQVALVAVRALVDRLVDVARQLTDSLLQRGHVLDGDLFLWFILDE